MKQTARQFAQFVLVGCANTAIGLSIILGLMYFLDVAAVPANLAGYAVGLCFSFYANGRWTFQQPFTRKSAQRFILAFALSYALNLIVLMAAIERGNMDPMLAQICAIVAYTAVFFVLSKVYVFPKASGGLAESTK